MGRRNDDTEAAAQRLESVIRRLTAASEPDAELPDFLELARQLFPVAHAFESLGFLSVAREVAYVEDALRRLRPESPAEPQHPGRRSLTVTPELEPAGRPVEEPRLSLKAQRLASRRSRMPRPVAVTLLLLLLAILVSILLLRWGAEEEGWPLARHRTATSTADAGAAAGSPTVIDDTPAVTPSPPAATPSPTPNSAVTTRMQLANEIAAARLALQQGDLYRAQEHVSAAALIDFSNLELLETVAAIVDALVNGSDGAAAGGYWAEEAALLDRAQALAQRFGLPVQAIERARARHATLERFDRIAPGDRASLRAAAGRRADVHLVSGRVERGSIRDVVDDVLMLEQATGVGSRSRGGQLSYVEPIPLAAIAEIRVYQSQE